MNDKYQKPEKIINIKEIIWDLLEQWKAVLLISILTMALVVGLKYAKDLRAYNSAMEEESMKSENALTKEERIEEALSGLTEDERATVQYLVKQNEWIDTEKDYINNSIRLRTNPVSQRSLAMTYFIEAENESDADIASLIYAYETQIKRGSVIGALAQIIDPDANDKYIAEIITFESDGDEQLHAAAQSDEAVITVRIILPEDTDAEAVKKLIETAVQQCQKDFSKSISPHKIKLIQSTEAYTFNREALDTRNNILNSINNLTNNTKNILTTLSDDAKSALEKVEEINKEDAPIELTDDTQAIVTEGEEAAAKTPGISKKYALLGFVLGAMLYAFAYLLIVIVRGRVNCASDLEYYTQTRLLGEIYVPKEHKGWDALFNSKLVDKFRFKRACSEIESTCNATEAVATACKHSDSKEVTVMSMSENTDKLTEEIKNKGIKVNKLENGESSEEDYLKIRNMLFVVGKETKIDNLTDAVSKCDYYDVNVLGSVFLTNI